MWSLITCFWCRRSIIHKRLHNWKLTKTRILLLSKEHRTKHWLTCRLCNQKSFGLHSQCNYRAIYAKPIRLSQNFFDFKIRAFHLLTACFATILISLNGFFFCLISGETHYAIVQCIGSEAKKDWMVCVMNKSLFNS